MYRRQCRLKFPHGDCWSECRHSRPAFSICETSDSVLFRFLPLIFRASHVSIVGRTIVFFPFPLEGNQSGPFPDSSGADVLSPMMSRHARRASQAFRAERMMIYYPPSTLIRLPRRTPASQNVLEPRTRPPGPTVSNSPQAGRGRFCSAPLFLIPGQVPSHSCLNFPVRIVPSRYGCAIPA